MRVRDPEALRRWRQRRGLSQRDLAYLCRCSQATISLLERGTMPALSESLALSLSSRLQVPWEDLFEPRDPEDDGRARRRAAAGRPGRAGRVAHIDVGEPSDV